MINLGKELIIMFQNAVKEALLERLPLYIDYLMNSSGDYVSAKKLADALKLGEIQVRKDLAKVSIGGKPKLGYSAMELLSDISNYLGIDKPMKAIIVGMGRLGESLYHYPGFSQYNIEIVAGFDINGNHHHLDEMETLCRKESIEIGIICVPKLEAQKVADLLIKNKIKAIWNFTSVRLDVPNDVIVKNENLVNSLLVLGRVKKQMEEANESR